MSDRLEAWVSCRAAARPEATAVVLREERMRYGELDAWSSRLAHQLIRQGLAPGDRVGLLVPRSPTAIASLVGVLKAGCVYVPIDPASPPARAAKVLRSCDAACLLAAGDVAKLLTPLCEHAGGGRGLRVGWVDDHRDVPEGVRPSFTTAELQRDVGPLPELQGPDAPAYVLFTSGSTGAPKGVVISHANVAHFVDWAVRYFGIEASDRLSGHSALHFDLSVFDIFGAFAAGAELHLVPPELNLLPHKLGGFIRESGLTQWFSVPSVMTYMAKFDVVRQDDFPALKRLIWCGEVMPTPTLIHWMGRLPHVSFTNLYGPTETTIASSHYTLPGPPADEQAPIPIGRPCGGEELHVLDPNLDPVPPGTTGELFIGGAGLSPGYWRDPETTSRAFVMRPAVGGRPQRLYRTGDLARMDEDGLFYFLGRNDSQIKSRGYRIELGEIEAALHTIDPLRESAVVAIASDGFEGATICCAFVPSCGGAIRPPGLRGRLAELLPGYMLPSRWLELEALPRNANGKIDRPRLRELFRAERGEEGSA